MTITSLAVKPLTKLQITTGVRRRSVNRGTRVICTACLIGDGGKSVNVWALRVLRLRLFLEVKAGVFCQRL
jgi:hypothetical protein